MALALPAMFVACQDQDVISTPNGTVEGQFVKLEKGFALIGSTESDAATRGQWISTNSGIKFAWRPNLTNAVAKTYAPDQIGLAWTGVCLDKDGNINADGSAVAAVDDRVFTNYKFNHFGWKINGTEPTVDECSPAGDFKTGTFTPVEGYSDGINSLAGTYNATTGEMVYTASADAITAWPGYTTADGATNGSEGLFNTNNSTVYAGQYIVYSPYDPKNTSNYIVATSKDEFAISGFQTEANRAKTMEEFTTEIFKYGYTTIKDGGDKTAKFATENLNGYVGIKLKGASGQTPTIKKVILYDATGKNLLTKVGLSAKGIYDGKSGKALYMDNSKVAKEYTETVTAAINRSTGIQIENDAYSYVTIPVLPTEAAISSLKVILINTDNLAVEKELKDITIERNAYATGAWIDFKDIDFTNAPYLATDMASLKAAISALDVAGNNGKDVSVRLLGNAEVSGKTDFATLTNVKTLTINGGKIIVPDATTGNGIELSIGDSYVVNSNIDVMQSCCKDLGGVLNVTGAAVLGGIINIGEAEDVDDAAHEAKLNFNGEAKVSVLKGTINNYGVATIVKTGTAEASHELDVDGGTINNYNTFSIETTGDKNKKDAKLYVKTGALNNAEGAEMTVAGVLAVENSAKASNEGIVVDKISSQVTGNIYDLGEAPGQYVSEVDDPTNRFNAALYYRPTTTVRFVGAAKTYDLEKLNDSRLKASIKTYEVAANSGVTTTFVSSADAVQTDITMENLIVKSALEVTAKTTITPGGSVPNYDAYITLNVTNLDVENGGTLTFSEVADNTKTVLNATNMVVKAGGAAAIGKFVCSEIANLTINAATTTPAAGAGSITFNFSSQTWISNKVKNEGEANILQATETGGADVAGDVWLLEDATSTGGGTWLNGIPTTWRK